MRYTKKELFLISSGALKPKLTAYFTAVIQNNSVFFWRIKIRKPFVIHKNVITKGNSVGEPPGNRTRDTLLKRKTKALRVDYHI